MMGGSKKERKKDQLNSTRIILSYWESSELTTEPQLTVKACLRTPLHILPGGPI